MAIHKLFAENLRAQCMRFESIAEVCRGIGINRQQFNKYLGGQALPNARTLTRLCTYFGIDEAILFSSTKVMTDGQSASAHFDGFLFDAALNHRPDIEAGIYNCYFPLQGFSGFVVRSVVAVSQRHGRFVFSRHTKISSPTTASALLAFGKHRGFVLSNGSTNYMLGLNSVPPRNVSFIALPKEPTGGTNLRFGLAVVHGISQPFSCQICIEYLGRGSTRARDALSRVGILALSDPSVPAPVATFMGIRQKDGGAQIIMPNFEGLILEPNS